MQEAISTTADVSPVDLAAVVEKILGVPLKQRTYPSGWVDRGTVRDGVDVCVIPDAPRDGWNPLVVLESESDAEATVRLADLIQEGLVARTTWQLNRLRDGQTTVTPVPRTPAA